MILSSITLNQLRNLKETTLSLSPRFNIFSGNNGSGKTSLLEGVHLLTTGRSFRSACAEEFIAYQAQDCVLSGLFQPKQPGESLVRLGLKRGRDGEVLMRVNEKPCHTRSELAKLVPIQTINTDTYQLLHLSSKGRRDFLDWGMFHVEHSVHSTWIRYARALKQRNAALKRVKLEGEAPVLAWDAELVESGQIIAHERKKGLTALIPFFVETLKDFLPNLLTTADVQIEYKRGWREDHTLENALSQALSRDVHLGYTSAGPHRADIKFSLNDTPVEAMFSRGQLKLFICALMLARSAWLLEATGRQSLFLLDDLHSELDEEASVRLLEGLKKLGGQVWITTVEADRLKECLQDEDIKMFHVEHGVLRAMDNVPRGTLSPEVSVADE